MHERHLNDAAFRGRMRSFTPPVNRPGAPTPRPPMHAATQGITGAPRPVTPRAVDGFSVPKLVTQSHPISQVYAKPLRPAPTPANLQPRTFQSAATKVNQATRQHHAPSHARSFAVPRQHRSTVLQRTAVKKSAQAIHKATRKRRLSPMYVFVLSASLFVLGIGAAGYAIWVVKHPSGTVAGASTEKSEVTKSSPFESPPTVDDYKNHTTQADLPRYVRIPGLRINARAKQVGYEPTKGLETPINIYDIGWYGQSGRPNDTKAMVFSVRTRGKSADSPYIGLDKLKPGNFIEVEQGDGNKLFYKVISSSPVEPGKFNMVVASSSADSKKQGLNIVSYSPTSPDSTNYEPTLIVYAVRM